MQIKKIYGIKNYSTWTTCPYCGHGWFLNLYEEYCPNCGEWI